MSPVPPSVRLAATVYGLLIVLLPSRLRARYGASMRRMFRHLARDAHDASGPLGVLGVTVVTAADLFVHIVRPSLDDRSRAQRPGPRRPAPSLGNPDSRTRGLLDMSQLFNDVRIASRGLRKRPGLAAVATLTLALGIGANTSIFSVVWGAWLKPLPYPEPDRLVRIADRHESFEPGAYSTTSIGNYVDMEEGNRTLESTTIFTFVGATLGEDSRRVTLLYAEPTLLTTLGITPEVGRDFTEEDVEGEGRVAILSHALWTEEYGASTDALGQDLILYERPWTIIGVAPEAFDFPREVDAIIPFQWTEEQRNAHGGRSMNAIGRLMPGVSIEAAQADLQAIYAGIARQYPESHDGWTAAVSPFREYVVGNDHSVLRLMSAAAVLLLLITCVNVASLLLARAESRKREVAIRGALGAGRGRILTAFLSESLLMGVLGGLLGIYVAYGGIRLLVSIFGDSLRRPSEIGLNETTLAVALALTLATSVAVALVPAFRLDLSRLTEPLRHGRSGADRGGVALRRTLVVSEIVLAVVLVSGAGLLVNTMLRLTRADLGFEPRGGVVVHLELPGRRYAEPADMDVLYRRLSESLEGRPGIVAVGAGDRVPPDGNITDNGIRAAGRPETATDFVVLREVTPGYFAAAGIEFVAGSPFEWLPPSLPETEAEVPIVINRALAEALFPGADAVGGHVESNGGRQSVVVGVVESVHQSGATEPARAAIYYPWPAVPLEFTSRPVLLLRVDGQGPDAETPALATLRRTLEEIDPEIRFSSQPLGDRLGYLYGEQEFALSLMAVFAGLALLLGTVGIYGVISFTVAERTREVGTRIALGAARHRVLGMVLRRGMGLAVPGVVLGLLVSAGLGKYLAGLLYGISPVDPTTYAVVTAIFLGTAVIACLVPARRAARVEPTEALRME